MSRQELEVMFGIDDLKKTRFAQELMAESKAKGKIEGKLEGKIEGKLEGKIEGKLEVIPSLLKKGFSVAEIAEILELEIDQVRQAIAKLN